MNTGVRKCLAAVVASVALLIAAPLAFAQAAGVSSTNWPARTASALEQLGPALDTARTNPGAARQPLTRAVSELSAVIDSAPCSERDLARLHFDRGLALAALGDHAAALLDFRQSDALRPSAAALQQIELARRRLRPVSATAGAAVAPTVERAPSQPISDQAWRLMRLVSPSIRWWIGLTAFAAFWGALGLRVLGPTRARTGIMSAAAVSLLLVATLGVGAVIAEHTIAGSHRDAVVLADKCIPHTGPDSVAYPVASFDGHDIVPRGLELRVLEQRDLPGKPGWAAWLRVRAIDNARMGNDDAGVWIPASDVAWVAPPRPA
jgi:hypothetical protein